MKHIAVLLETYSDLVTIRNVILSHDAGTYSVSSFTNPSSFISSLHSISFDLLVMDLAFPVLGQNILFILDYIPSSLPVIIVSNMIHLKKLALLHPNVVSFYTFDQSQTLLMNDINRLLAGTPDEKIIFFDEQFVFPKEPIRFKKNSLSYFTRDIRYFQRGKNNIYHIFFTDGTSSSEYSVPFYEVLASMHSQKITSLVPVQSGLVVNKYLINTLWRHRNGRWQFTLLGLENTYFTISPKYKNELIEFMDV